MACAWTGPQGSFGCWRLAAPVPGAPWGLGVKEGALCCERM